MTETRWLLVVLRALPAVLFCVAGAAVGTARAEVSLKNGNFFVGYTDVLFEGGIQPKIERVYNSKSPYHTGIFGWGWGTEYEVNLEQRPDGTVVVNEFGGGAENRFFPEDFDENASEEAVDLLIGAARLAGIIADDRNETHYRTLLGSDPSRAGNFYSKLVAKDLLPSLATPLGARLHSNRFGKQTLTRVRGGWRRAHADGRADDFDEDGRLIRIVDAHGNWMILTHDAAGRIRSIEDSLGRRMWFHVSDAGLVERIETHDGKIARYEYNHLRELTYSKDVAGNEYRYEYSSDRRHNLTRISYGDGTHRDVEYYGRDQKENVKLVRDRDESTTSYRYEKESTDNGYVLTRFLRSRLKGGREIDATRYVYEYRSDPTKGSTYLHREEVSSEWFHQETVYHPQFGLPLRRVEAGETTDFAYDDRGRIVSMTTAKERKTLAYHPSFDKVVRVEVTTEVGVNWSEFEYDGRANLRVARNSDGAWVELEHDERGRVRRINEKTDEAEAESITFTYDHRSRPVFIESKVGIIEVTWGRDGGTEGVRSTAGRDVSLAVYAAFARLQAIIRPAGVTLGM